MTYTEAQRLIFAIGAMTDEAGIWEKLDELSHAIQGWHDQAQNREAELINARQEAGVLRNEIARLEEALASDAESFDSVFAANVLGLMTKQNLRLDDMAQALARLGAVVEAGDG